MRILVTAGPTREYIDDVRFLTNASSGQMGYALARAAAERGAEVELVTGPVCLTPPAGCRVHAVETTTQMHDVCQRLFPNCDGVIAAAAVCDYRPKIRTRGKIGKTGHDVVLELEETTDVLAALGQIKGSRWLVGFALEAEMSADRALRKLREKHCDVIVLNGTQAIGSTENAITLLDGTGNVLAQWQGDKPAVAQHLVQWILTRWGAPSA